MEKIIVIDGTSNAGKTSLSENIKRTAENVYIIPEATIYAKQHPEKYTKRIKVPTNAQEEKDNQPIFFQIELDRLQEANKLAKQGKIVFLDGWILEVLAVAYSFEEIKNWSGIYTNAVTLYERLLEVAQENGIKLPDEYIWLQANSDEILKRNKSRQIERGQKLSETDWIEKSLINNQIAFFNRLRIPENENKFHLIDTNNITKQEVLESVKSFIELKKKEMEISDD